MKEYKMSISMSPSPSGHGKEAECEMSISMSPSPSGHGKEAECEMSISRSGEEIDKEDDELEEDGEDKTSSAYDWAEEASLEYTRTITPTVNFPIPSYKQERVNLYDAGQIETAFMAGYHYSHQPHGHFTKSGEKK